jgi:hypothetical protein
MRETNAEPAARAAANAIRPARGVTDMAAMRGADPVHQEPPAAARINDLVTKP